MNMNRLKRAILEREYLLGHRDIVGRRRLNSLIRVRAGGEWAKGMLQRVKALRGDAMRYRLGTQGLPSVLQSLAAEFEGKMDEAMLILQDIHDIDTSSLPPSPPRIRRAVSRRRNVQAQPRDLFGVDNGGSPFFPSRPSFNGNTTSSDDDSMLGSALPFEYSPRQN